MKMTCVPLCIRENNVCSFKCFEQCMSGECLLRESYEGYYVHITSISREKHFEIKD